MILNILKPRKALNKAYLKVSAKRSEIECFKTNLLQLLDRIDETESEEFHKNLVSDFLKKTYYEPNHFINTKGRNDLVIHNVNSTVGVIVEAKKPKNTAEMISKDNLNAKAFQELILYYLRERITQKNLEIKHLVATNINEWFIFDVSVFERLFAQNKKLVYQFTEFEGGRLADIKTDFFYKQIAEPFIAEIKQEIEFTYFNIQDYQKPLKNTDKADDNQLIALYKLLSPEHLLKLPFINDSNSLDKKFYNELLHIIGLVETKEGGKKVIQRNKEGERNTGTLLEAAIIQLDSLDKISRLEKPVQFGSTNTERLYNVALELSITWINRILFLKLLEAQLISYHKGDKSYSFLNMDKIKNYDDLNSLFFQVLAKKYEERNDDVKKLFEKIPYLNSSLFEPTDLEHTTLFISNLKDDIAIPIIGTTKLTDDKGKKLIGKLPPLEYLFKFLDAYNFSSEGAEEIQEENKTLINASVLGLIFEKINGYKDGSFFTPGFITMYMCKETIRKAVLQKFNETKQWNCESIDALYDKIEDRKEANEIVNSLKICDPAVGSGHFLVSALNEVISIKNDLKILQDRDGKRLKEYTIEVVNDELIVTDDDGQLFEYKPANKESQRIQETLFHEKQTIIENCLFGVDINPNSVKICRLRLWIELLKNAYYKNAKELETLPNIDINIKCGNSLVSRFAIDADLKQALKKSKWSIDGYRVAVDTYRNAENKEQKRAMEKLIADIKSDFRSEIFENDSIRKKSRKLKDDLNFLLNQGSLFGMSKKEKGDWDKRVNKLTEDIKIIEAETAEIRDNKIFENAFEWRFEFPEVLNDDGDFVGFDVVIGNPPYIRQEEFVESKDFFKKRFTTFVGTADLYVYFVELSFNLLTFNGQFSYIIPNKWMRTGYGKTLREYLKEQAIERIIDFNDLPVFDEATTYPSILEICKRPSNQNFKAANIKTLNFNGSLDKYLNEIQIEVFTDTLQNDGWNLTNNLIQKILFKIKNNGITLSSYVGNNINRGVLTGLNEAFVINAEIKKKLVDEDPNSIKIIKPFLAGRDIKRYQVPESDKYLVFTRRGIDIEKYPAIHKYLLQFKTKLEPKPNGYNEIINGEWGGRKSGSYKWYEIQDAVDYYLEFEKPKIIYPNICKRPEFTYEEHGKYTNQKCFIITKFTMTLLGILNSQLFYFLFKTTLPKLRGDFYEPSYTYFKDFPVIDIKNKEIETLVQKCLFEKSQNPNADIKDLENQIDYLVYKLYNLSEAEIKIVEEDK